jgi:hypothetical protein
MRSAFVVQLGSATQPSRQHFEGSIEEVDTGRELRFHSTAELLGFLGQCFESARRDHEPHQEEDRPR